MSPSKKVPSVPSRHTAHPEIEATADLPGLRFGMEALRDNMKLPGTAAYRFATTMGHFDKHDGWADDFGAFVAAICDKDTALELVRPWGVRPKLTSASTTIRVVLWSSMASAAGPLTPPPGALTQDASWRGKGRQSKMEAHPTCGDSTTMRPSCLSCSCLPGWT
jgi:hypothetical protein